ncbi:hypothetical protein [Halomonas dongshanensis]|uniref:Uncharacterized protein n=1 Tax=Halomonas dongshanensis TaxID=2890835 RepID=A0ABT2EFR0_9GAMM|nr:hypothetical protein [Halomonas dongshanensis]MCS2609950.1 hypothetical protein [Halomonas dongshanensis]
MRLGQIIVVLAVAMAGTLAALASSEAFETRVVRLEGQRVLPAIEASLHSESVAINGLFLHYADEPALWMSAHLALSRYGEAAREVLLAYGYLPEFQEILARFGPDVMLPIAYYRAHDVATLRARHWLSERYQEASRWWRDTPAESHEGDEGQNSDISAWGPDQRGLMGIALVAEEGHALLHQFVRDADGDIHWLQSERVVAGVGDFFTSGVRNLESQWRRDEAIGAADVGWAGVDLLLVASSVKVLRAGRLARGARVGSVEAQGARTGVRQGLLAAGTRFATLPRAAKFAALTATAYVIVRHPSLISALGVNVAKWLGLPTWVGQFAVWLIVLLPLLVAVRFIWRWVVTPLLWLLLRLLPVKRLYRLTSQRRLARFARDLSDQSGHQKAG